MSVWVPYQPLGSFSAHFFLFHSQLLIFIRSSPCRAKRIRNKADLRSLLELPLKPTGDLRRVTTRKRSSNLHLDNRAAVIRMCEWCHSWIFWKSFSDLVLSQYKSKYTFIKFSPKFFVPRSFRITSKLYLFTGLHTLAFILTYNIERAGLHRILSLITMRVRGERVTSSPHILLFVFTFLAVQI